MARDIRKNNYLNATSITQQFLTDTFNSGENQLEAICTITNRAGDVIRVSSIPKYVGNTFYEGRATLPVIQKTLGQFLAPHGQFSDAQVSISNVDGMYSTYFVGGADYSSFIGASMVFQFGIRDIEASYVTMFDGVVKNSSGYGKNLQTISFTAADKFGLYNKALNLPSITEDVFPSAPTSSLGKLIPFCAGDWSTGFNVTQTASTSVNNGVSDDLVISYTTENFYGGIVGYNIGGTNFIFATGNYTPDTINNVLIQRGGVLLATNFNSTPLTVGGYYYLDIVSLQKDGGGTVAYVPQDSDIAIIDVKIPFATSKYDNIVEQVQSIMQEVLGINSNQFSSNWATLIAKPAISGLKSRFWIGNNNTAIIDYVKSMLTQVRLEMFVNREGLIDLNSLHTDDWPAVASMRQLDQFQVVEASLNIEQDEDNYFNAANANYAFLPVNEKTALTTDLFINVVSRAATGQSPNSQTSSDQSVQKTIDFPNLYIKADVETQLKEMIRFYSFSFEYISVSTAWNGLLDDLGDFLNFNYDLSSLTYNNAPCMIRDISTDMDKGMISYKLLSLYGFNYPNYTSGFTDMISSYNQVLT